MHLLSNWYAAIWERTRLSMDSCTLRLLIFQTSNCVLNPAWRSWLRLFGFYFKTTNKQMQKETPLITITQHTILWNRGAPYDATDLQITIKIVLYGIHRTDAWLHPVVLHGIIIIYEYLAWQSGKLRRRLGITPHILILMYLLIR